MLAIPPFDFQTSNPNISTIIHENQHERWLINRCLAALDSQLVTDKC